LIDLAVTEGKISIPDGHFDQKEEVMKLKQTE